MPVHNADISAIFDEIADLLEIQGENPFRIRAYRNAGREMQSLGVPASEMIAKGEDLTELPGIGDDLAAKIKEIVETGKCKALEKLRTKLPPTITTLLRLPGLGPKRVKTLYDELEVESVAALKQAARAGKIRELPGFGEKTESAILEALAQHVEEVTRFKLAVAAQYAEPLAAWLKKSRNVKQVQITGSYRRCKETVGDLDILAATTGDSDVMERFVRYDEVREVMAHGDTRATVRLKCGLQVDLRVVPQESFGAALQYFTGSKAHNIEIRRLGQQKKLKINEYGVFRGSKAIAGNTEKSVYAAVGLSWIAPELRENRGEIEAAHKGKLPRLVELKHLRGDLHAHTKATDGHHTLREMAEAAQEHGFEYLAITEHSRRLTVAHGLDVHGLRKQMEEIDRLNEKLSGITLLKGIEVDILEDGKLDLPDEVLGECDIVVGAVHSKFNLARARQTTRILKAMDRPHFTILAHPSGRLLGSREAYDVDMLKIIRQARERGCYLELNAHPERLDLLDIYCQMARDEGVLVAISSDAHSVRDFDNLLYGVGQARRGWLEKKDVLNTRPFKLLKPLLQRTII
ncbi:MAG: DNA polymerase/3'-5' exonuclease PolX [Gammaproteobacteria bacterium]|nr:DNA polymerase/3'-5' exonuclease PolX [Gammaproteobacteria bacterium]